VFDFGGLKNFKRWAEHMFDHTLLIAEDDPQREVFEALPRETADIRIVPAVGCERFAEMAYNKMAEIIEYAKKNGDALNPTARVKSVEVFEHGANSAIYEG
jgi:6-pyruvoyltetrahydropterin/6-carboxytetrahydropterin synthase